MDERPAGSGDYPIERRAGEVERLRIQGEALAPDTDAVLDRIGVRPGWKCLDLACGPRGITDALAARVGPRGHLANPETVFTCFTLVQVWGRAPGVAGRSSRGLAGGAPSL